MPQMVTHPATGRGGAARGLLLTALLAGASLASFPAQADRIRHPTAVFAGLDKITGRIISFEAAIDETVQFGSLQITPHVCYTRPPTEAPLTTGFVEADEVETDNRTKRIFSGWMFAASPGLNGVEHPVYDVWLTDCKGGKDIIPSAPETADLTDDDAPFLKPGTGPGGKPGATPRPRQPRPATAGIPGQLPGGPLDPGGAAQAQIPAQAPLPPGGLRPPGTIPTSAPAPRRPSQQFFPAFSNPVAPQDPTTIAR